MQNTSHAVMSQRTEGRDAPDDFPTPPWATRALMEHVIEQARYTRQLTCLEPACGAGHMAKVLGEHFGSVVARDAFDYDFGEVSDFLSETYNEGSFDWVITNPPFRLAEEFVSHSLPIARRGIAILARTVFIESVGRYNNLFKITPPSKIAQFTERVPMVKGRLDRSASTATGYAWLVWEKGSSDLTRLVWIPPCRKRLEKDGDYLNLPVAGRKGALKIVDQEHGLFGPK